MRTFPRIKTVRCPVCPEKLIPQGLRNHIIGRAKNEVYQFYTLKKGIMPHQKYIEKNVKIIEIKKLKLK